MGITFIKTTAPSAKTRKDYDATYRDKNRSEINGKSRDYYSKNRDKMLGRSRSRKRVTDEKAYINREIIALDGEGWDSLNEWEFYRDTPLQLYTMFAGMSSADRQYRTIQNPAGLGTVEIIEFLFELAGDSPDALMVIYGGSYDFNMWCADLSEDELHQLRKRESILWGDYKLSWRGGKYFRISRLEENGKKTTLTVWDIVSFFQAPFVSACDSWLGNSWDSRDMIIENKAKRGQFDAEHSAEVAEYNAAELRVLIELTRALRARLAKVGWKPKRFDGPGAIASEVLKLNRIKDAMCESPAEVAEAARYAYCGGRFEVIKYGSVTQQCFEYDINSAYPTAMLELPDLTHGHWMHKGRGAKFGRFSLVHIRSRFARADIPAPLWIRDERGSIFYPQCVDGWYWAPEAQAAIDYIKRTNELYDLDSKITVLESWNFVEEVQPNGKPYRPFAFVQDLYDYRKKLKAEGDGAQLVVKLGINSLYGKTAQQVGAREYRGQWKLPPFHQLEWAGFITANCRATILSAASHDPEAVIAFETDALFVTHEIPVKRGKSLGDFEYSGFSELTYCQSGTYFATLVSDDGKETYKVVEKTRGIDRGTLHKHDVMEAYEKESEFHLMEAPLTRFVGAGAALQQDFGLWRRWTKTPKKVSSIPGVGKRVCNDYGIARMGKPVPREVWHTTFCPIGTLDYEQGQRSYQKQQAYPVEWVNPNPAMSEMEELRNSGHEGEWE